MGRQRKLKRHSLPVKLSTSSSSSGFAVIGASISATTYSYGVDSGQTWFRLTATKSPYTNSGTTVVSIAGYHGGL